MRWLLVGALLAAASANVARSSLVFNPRIDQYERSTVSPNGRFLFVSYRQDGGNNCVKTYSLPNIATSTFSVCNLQIYGWSLRVSPDSRSLYVAGSFSGSGFRWGIEHLDIQTNGTLTLIDAVSAGGGFDSFTLSPDGRHLYGVGNGELSDRESFWSFTRETSGSNVGRLTFLRKYADVGYSNYPSYTVVSGDGRNVYVGSSDDSLFVFSRDLVTGELRQTRRLDRIAQGLCGLHMVDGTADTGEVSSLYVIGARGVHVHVFSRSLDLLHTYTTNVPSGFRKAPVFWVDRTAAVLASEARLIAYRRDPLTGLLSQQNYVTDDTSPEINTLHVVDRLIYTQTRVYLLLRATNKGGEEEAKDGKKFFPDKILNSSTSLSSSSSLSKGSVSCTLTYRDLLTSQAGSCTTTLPPPPSPSFTYACAVTPSFQLEIDQVPTWEPPSTPLVTVGWLDSTLRSYRRFNLKCQGAIDRVGGFECDDEIRLGGNFGTLEHYEVRIASDFLSVCELGRVSTRCCNIRGVEGGTCDRVTISSRPQQCPGRYHLEYPFTGLGACLVPTESPTRVVQHVSRFGTGEMEDRLHYRIGVKCEAN